MLTFTEPANIDTVLGIFTKTLVKLEKREAWLATEMARLEDELVRIEAAKDRHQVEGRRIVKAGFSIEEIVGG